ncbi:MAG TPA: hypothetical protein VKZ53_05645 [Candidatus Angelobacter sp.]|nr:hypothetical protein [Candidatus Angelobacter sp.]
MKKSFLLWPLLLAAFAPMLHAQTNPQVFRAPATGQIAQPPACAQSASSCATPVPTPPPAPPSKPIFITPAARSLMPKQSLTLSANQNVRWSLTGNALTGPSTPPWGPGTLSTSGPSSSVVYNQPDLCGAQLNGVGLSCSVTITATDPNNSNNTASTVVTLIPPPLSVNGVTPSSGSGFTGTFTASGIDNNTFGIGTPGNPNGTDNYIDLKFAPAGQPNAESNVCEIFIDFGDNSVALQNDAGTFAPPVTAGTSQVLSNSQCSVNAATASSSAVGDTMTMTVTVTFSSAFAGPKTIYEQVWDAGFFLGYVPVGVWTIP